MKKRVLVADNEPRLRKVIERVLAENGYAVKSAANGSQALKEIAGFNPHMVIAEVGMPEIDGFELCRRIRKNQKYSSVRFIFLTSKASREDEIEGLKLGADDYILKPVDVDKLLARVDARLRWLNGDNLGKDSGGTIQGSLEDRNLVDVLQLLEVGKKTGKLSLTQGEKTGCIAVKEGKIASAGEEKKKGRQAVFSLLSWNQGRFSFQPREEVEEEESLEITPLLLKWAQDTDEKERGFNESKTRISGKDRNIKDFIKFIKNREQKGKQ